MRATILSAIWRMPNAEGRHPYFGVAAEAARPRIGDMSSRLVRNTADDTFVRDQRDAVNLIPATTPRLARRRRRAHREAPNLGRGGEAANRALGASRYAMGIPPEHRDR